MKGQPAPRPRPEGLAEYVASERDRIRALHAEGAVGQDITTALSALADHVIRTLYRAATEAHQPTGYTPPAVLAIGGYGRRALSPASDLDLLFLTDERPSEEARDPVVDDVLHGLWDLRYKVGFATRNLEDTLALAADDLHTATAMLTLRGLCGAEDAAHAATSAVWRRLSGARANRLLDHLEEAMRLRHERFGGSVFLLEPNLKRSPGGLRDLQTVLWAAILRFRIRGWQDFLPRGVGSPSEAKALFKARRFMLRVRNSLMYANPHAADRLTFRHQEQVAADLGFSADRAGVEAFMAEWYRHATEVQKRARLILQRCRDMGQIRRRSPTRMIGDHFRVFNGQITVDERALFERSPAQAMVIFREARRLGVPVYGFSLVRAMEAATRLAGPQGKAWREAPVVVEAFKEILAHPEDPHDALGDLHEVGLLGAILPEFGAITHRTHHDLYHVYTVDIHTLHAIRRLKALHRGDLAESEPLLTEAMGQISSPFSLYLGLLMHDAGKALGKGHAVKGARLIPAIGKRFKLPPSVTREVEWLVRDHLIMAHISQRRDLDDEDIIQQFARRVGAEEALSKLFILTWADASTTGPQAYTDWKAALLAQLYLRTRQQLGAGLGLFDDPKRRVARVRRVVSEALERRGQVVLKDVNGELDDFFNALPTPYFRRTLARDIVRHYEMLLRLGGASVVMEVDARPRGDLCRVHIVTADRSGLCAEIAGVLTAHRFEILGAALNSVRGAGGRGPSTALDVFEVRPASGDVLTADDPIWGAVQADLAAVLEGEETVEALLGPRGYARRGPRAGRRPTEQVPVEVNVHEGASRRYSVIEVRDADRVGLLYDITRAFAEAHAEIYLARVSTEGDQALDTFYVSDAHGGPLSPERAEEVVATLMAVLDSPGAKA